MPVDGMVGASELVRAEGATTDPFLSETTF